MILEAVRISDRLFFYRIDMRLWIAILLMTLLSAADMNAKTRSNPVISRNWPDPTVWKDGDTFYSIATGVGTILTSKDMVEWTDMKISPLSADASAEARKVGRHFWAPDMVKLGDKWMLYLTCYNSAEDCGIVAFESSSPTGPWEYVSLVTHSKINGIKDTIDPEVLKDPSSGKVWMFFGSVGKMHRVELNAEGTAVAPGAGYVHVAGLDIEDNPSRTSVFEGAYLYRHKGFWYLFASGGKYYNESYRIVVGRSRSLKGTFVDKQKRKMTDGFASVVIRSEDGDDFYGPGHNAEIFKDVQANHYIMYHCHQRSSGNQGARYTLIQRICWGKDGWPYVEGGKPAIVAESPCLYK